MIEKILNEIHRLKEDLNGYSASEGLDYIESYINTLQQSIPSALEVKAVSFKHELEYFLYILNDDSLTHQDKVEVLRDKIKERLKNM